MCIMAAAVLPATSTPLLSIMPVLLKRQATAPLLGCNLIRTLSALSRLKLTSGFTDSQVVTDMQTLGSRTTPSRGRAGCAPWRTLAQASLESSTRLHSLLRTHLTHAPRQSDYRHHAWASCWTSARGCQVAISAVWSVRVSHHTNLAWPAWSSFEIAAVVLTALHGCDSIHARECRGRGDAEARQCCSQRMMQATAVEKPLPGPKLLGDIKWAPVSSRLLRTGGGTAGAAGGGGMSS